MKRISRHRVDGGLKAMEKESSVFKNIRIRVDGALIFPFNVPLPPPHNYYASLLPSNTPPQPLLFRVIQIQTSVARIQKTKPSSIFSNPLPQVAIQKVF